jgi:curved DNA-binding protein CbpA
MKNYYKVLGVPTDAKPEEIKKAYEVLSKQYAPDNNKGDKYAEERFIDISVALRTLSDAEKRKDYDKILGEIQPRLETGSRKEREDETKPAGKRHPAKIFPFLLILSVAVFAVYAIVNRKDTGRSERLVFSDTISNVSKPRAGKDSSMAAVLPVDTVATLVPAEGNAIKEERKNKAHAKQPAHTKVTVVMKEDAAQAKPVEIDVKAGLFIGAGKNHVLNVQGTPTTIVKYENNSEMWYFGKSTIYFAGNKVSGYRNADNNLVLPKSTQ